MPHVVIKKVRLPVTESSPGKVPGEPGQPIDLLGAVTIREDVPTFFLRVRWLRSTSMISFRTWDRRLHSRELAIARGRRIYVGTSG
jgi:hypothetical protein